MRRKPATTSKSSVSHSGIDENARIRELVEPGGSHVGHPAAVTMSRSNGALIGHTGPAVAQAHVDPP